jgi:hypothetical protein
MNFKPLKTKKFKPTKEGKTVELLDKSFKGFLLLLVLNNI